jgi:hypothetical protein
VFSLLVAYFVKLIVFNYYAILLLKTLTMCLDLTVNFTLTINIGSVSRCNLIKVNLIIVCKLY